mmetsp:Transcript_29811/g.40930  ORF Transcript_29811/g.40930 Transcript_29811/m.40930 type:complete len:1031 (+) Transcript_29811:203-3295(+)
MVIPSEDSDINGITTLLKVDLPFHKQSGTVSSRHLVGTGDYLTPPLSLRSNNQSNRTTSLTVSAGAAVDTDLILDIFVLYTKEALADVGGSVSALKGMIYSANDASNVLLAKSQVSLRFRIVGIAKVANSFIEPVGTSSFPACNTLIEWVTYPDDGNLNEAQKHRDFLAADHVTLVSSAASFSSSICGVGWVNPTFMDIYAYTVINVLCVEEITFTHEIGHTWGCQHDRYSEADYAAANPTFYGFSDCWEDASRSDCTCYASIMTYDCHTPQNHCTRCYGKPLLANPNVIDSGNPAGRANAACALQFQNNRYIPIAYRKSVQPGGILFSISSSSAVYSTCCTLTITGWQLVQNLNDQPTVTLDGRPAVVVSFTVDSVVVRSSVVSGPSSSAGNVVVTSSSGRVTTLYSAFSYVSPRSRYAETFLSGSLASTKWASVGEVPWLVQIVSAKKARVYKNGESSPYDSAAAVLQYTAATNSSVKTGSCTERILSLSFSYSAYSNYVFCYGNLLVQSQAVGSQTWKTLWSRLGLPTGASMPYLNVSISFVENIAAVRIVANTKNEYGCRYSTPMIIENLVVGSSLSCMAALSCSTSTTSQLRGVIYSVSPQVVLANTCYLVTIIGVQLSEPGGDDVVSVSLNGVPALSIVSKCATKVVVMSPSVPVSYSSAYGDVVVTTAKGRETILPAGFSFAPYSEQSTYLETFHSGSFDTIPRWISTGTLPLSFANYLGNEYLFINPSLGADESYYGEITYNTAPNTIATGNCSETLLSLSFSFNAYSRKALCYGSSFQVLTQTNSLSPWSARWQMIPNHNIAGGIDANTLPWTRVNLTINGATAVKLTAKTLINYNCRYFAPIFLDNLAVTSRSTCSPTVACKSLSAGVSSPSKSPSSSNRVTKVPSPTPTIAVSIVPSIRSFRPSCVPSALQTISTSKNPSSSTSVIKPSKIPSFVPSTIPSTVPTIKPKTNSPTSKVSSNIPSRKSTILLSVSPSRKPSTQPSRLSSKLPSRGPSSRNPTVKSTTVPTRKLTRKPTLKP